MAKCDVVPYDIAALKDCLLRHSTCSESILNAKVQTTVFEEYFDHLGARTMVVERDYVDRDYLEDFAGYYVKCFHEYRKKCTRLHFFSTAFTQADFDGLLRGEQGTLTGSVLQANYLGFVVVKPLPQTIIGRTCLRSYGDDSRRKYPITRDYEANLAGFPLVVKDSLAFQEQDSVVAACATSALWSAFHGTGKLFQHRIPTPVEITRSATEGEPSESRNIPNDKGLTSSQMAHGIREVGLEPLLVSANDPAVLRNTVYAYVRGRVPLILGIVLFDDWRPGVAPVPVGPWQQAGEHAVAVTGFSLGKATPVSEPGTGFMLESSRIDQLYVHDDGVGPFSRMLMDEKVEPLCLRNGQTLSEWSMHTSWRRSHSKQLGMRAVPLILMAPLYHKIRIPYSTAEDLTRAFDHLVTTTVGSKISATNRLTWDIRLATGSDVKTQVVNEGLVLGKPRAKLLETPLPRFLWHASASLGGSRVVDLLFDATDIQQGNLVRAAIEYDVDVTSAIRTNAATMLAKPVVTQHPVRHVFEWFAVP